MILKAKINLKLGWDVEPGLQVLFDSKPLKFEEYNRVGYGSRYVYYSVVDGLCRSFIGRPDRPGLESKAFHLKSGEVDILQVYDLGSSHILNGLGLGKFMDFSYTYSLDDYIRGWTFVSGLSMKVGGVMDLAYKFLPEFQVKMRWLGGYPAYSLTYRGHVSGKPKPSKIEIIKPAPVMAWDENKNDYVNGPTLRPGQTVEITHVKPYHYVMGQYEGAWLVPRTASKIIEWADGFKFDPERMRE